MPGIKNNLSRQDVDDIVTGAITLRDVLRAEAEHNPALYSEHIMTQVAMYVMRHGHQGQFREDGTHYILHTQAVGDAQYTEEAKQVGYLHDLIEDTAFTIEDLQKIGFGAEVIDAIDLLSIKPAENQYLNKTEVIGAFSQLAYDPKLADSWFNGHPDNVSWKQPLYVINVAYFMAIKSKDIKPGLSMHAFKELPIFVENISKVMMSFERLEKLEESLFTIDKRDPVRFKEIMEDTVRDLSDWKGHVSKHALPHARPARPFLPDLDRFVKMIGRLPESIGDSVRDIFRPQP